MSTENETVNAEFEINNRIDTTIETIMGSKSITLPSRNHQLVNEYINKIENKYDVSRSKEDTDNAINLLYIAYNTTPQEEGDIRVIIDQLMVRLIKLQGNSEQQMRRATTDARSIVKTLNEYFVDWKNVLDQQDNKELTNFIKEDLIDLAKDIHKRADRISNELMEIANIYNEIIVDTTKVTNQSEKALSTRLINKQMIEDEITKNNAERDKLQSLVTSLEEDIKKYEKVANEYKKQAETAEERAFIMSIVHVGAQIISSLIPAISAGLTSSATGGASLIAASSAGTEQQLVNSESASTDNDKTAKAIQTKKNIADKQAEIAKNEREKQELEKNAEELKVQKENMQGNKDTNSDTKAAQLEALEKRINDNLGNINAKKTLIDNANTTLNALKESLKSLSDNMEQMSNKQEGQARSLRDLQNSMLNRIEEYEKEKRTQAAELVKINALLTGKKSQDEIIKLAIMSLNLSLKALKRMREIIIEISHFFHCFAAFMQQVMENSSNQEKSMQKALDINNQLTMRHADRIKRTTNEFFITQTAEWQAIEFVSTKFADNFKEGWSTMNKLCGKYLTGEDLTDDYYKKVSEVIENISTRGQNDANAKLGQLQRYRDKISDKKLN